MTVYPAAKCTAFRAARLDVDLQAVVGEFEAAVRRQLRRAVREEQTLGSRRVEGRQRFVERQVATRLPVELAAQERRFADEEIRLSRRLRERVTGARVAGVRD